MTYVALAVSLVALFAAAIMLRRLVRSLLSMTDAEIKRELNKDAPIDMIERENEFKRRRMKRR